MSASAVLRQQQRLRHHLGVGLLRVRPHDDLALEHAAALVVEHGLEHLAALAAAGRVVDHQRGVGVLRALAAGSRRGMPASVPSPSKRTNSWLRTTAPPMVKAKSLKRARAPIAAISDETWTGRSGRAVILTWSTWASSPTTSSSAVLT